jgi:hypothetical protein
LARILQRNEKLMEAHQRLQEAIPLVAEDDDDFPSVANSLAWARYLLGVELDSAATLARRALNKANGDINIMQTLAAILVRQDNWDEATPLVRRWATMVEEKSVASGWPDFVLLFQDALQRGHGEAIAALLDRELWEPMRAALVRATRSDSSADVPERLRDAVAALVTQLQGDKTQLLYPLVRR